MSRLTRPGEWDDALVDGMLWLAQSARRVILAGVINTLVAGALYSLIEGAGPIEGAYWATVTGSSTGYGDFSPQHTLGRLVAVYTIISMVFVWVPVWVMYLVGAMQERTGDAWSHAEQDKLLSDVADIKSRLAHILGDTVLKIDKDGTASLHGTLKTNRSTPTEKE